MIYLTGHSLADLGQFPDASRAPRDLPLAVGRVLSASLMLRAYARGIFAWSDDPVTWWSPDPRAVIDPPDFHVSRSLARTLRRRPFRVTVDADFAGVVRGCAAPRETGEESWITATFARCFDDLHEAGLAHSIECWSDDRLVGGVFGVAVAGLFSAESMFHRETDASKVALWALVRLLERAGYGLLDVQVLTPHTASLGAREIARREYLARLAGALAITPAPLPHGEIDTR